MADADCPCVGVCLPDEDAAYCIGCGRPWGAAGAPPPAAVPPAPNFLPGSVHVIERGWLSSNNILLYDGEEATLIDSGYVGHAEHTVKLVKSALAGRRLARLINTHSHSDHIGGNAALQRACGCAIHIPVGIEAHIANWDENALLLAPAAQRADRFRHDGVVRPGETLVMGGLEWQAHAAPGHDMDALVFHCPEARLLISGDALWEDGFGIIFGELLGQPGALRATRETLAMIARLPIATVIPGHGRPFTDIVGALERANQRLAAFAADPARLARNAVRACFLFNLLDLGGLPRAELEAYLDRVPFFRAVGRDRLGMAAPALAAWLLVELGKTGALTEIDGILRPTLAA